MMKQSGVGSQGGRAKKGKSASGAKGGKKTGARGGGRGGGEDEAGGVVEVDRRRLASEDPAISPGDADESTSSSRSSKPLKQAVRKQAFINGGEAPEKGGPGRLLPPNQALPMSKVIQSTKKPIAALRKLGVGAGTNTVFENGGEVSQAISVLFLICDQLFVLLTRSLLLLTSSLSPPRSRFCRRLSNHHHRHRPRLEERRSQATLPRSSARGLTKLQVAGGLTDPLPFVLPLFLCSSLPRLSSGYRMHLLSSSLLSRSIIHLEMTTD